MEDNDLRFIQDQIGYSFKNVDLLQQAFVRRSYAKENGGEDNEILEFIGDKVLDFIVVKVLAEKYGFFLSDLDDYDPDDEFNEFCTEYQENKLTEFKKRLVGKKMLAYKMDMLGFADYLIMGKGDIRNNVQEQDSVKEDLFEAILGAVALDSKWNLSELQDVVEVMLDPDSELDEDTELGYVELIQDWCWKRNDTSPFYHFEETGCHFVGNIQNVSSAYPYSIMSTYGNNRTNGARFFCTLKIDDDLQMFKGSGNSKSEARKDASKAAYEYLENNDLIISIRTEIDNPNRLAAINQLETLARRGYFSIPTYKFNQEYAENGNPIWKCECRIKEEENSFLVRASSKREAKKTAAFEMLKYVLREN